MYIGFKGELVWSSMTTSCMFGTVESEKKYMYIGFEGEPVWSSMTTSCMFGTVESFPTLLQDHETMATLPMDQDVGDIEEIFVVWFGGGKGGCLIGQRCW
jgi:hypothetical protein